MKNVEYLTMPILIGRLKGISISSDSFHIG